MNAMLKKQKKHCMYKYIYIYKQIQANRVIKRNYFFLGNRRTKVKANKEGRRRLSQK